jgi:hypothetical protein
MTLVENQSLEDIGVEIIALVEESLVAISLKDGLQKCSKRNVQSVTRIAHFHLSRVQTSQYFVVTVSQRKYQMTIGRTADMIREIEMDTQRHRETSGRHDTIKRSEIPTMK